MMGVQDAPARLFYDFDLEAHVPANHILREIDRFLDISMIRHQLAPHYSHLGRPSIDPELIIRMLVVGYVLGIRSERRLGFGYWVVQSKADGDFLGEVGLADYHRDTEPTLDGRPEAGWVLKACAHGKGYATEAVTAMMHWADKALSCTHTAAMFDPTYSASINVAKKVGFENEILGRYGDQEALFMERTRQ